MKLRKTPKEKAQTNLMEAIDSLLAVQDYLTYKKSPWRSVVGSLISIAGIVADVIEKEAD